MPRGAESGDASADNHAGDFLQALGRGKRRVVTQAVAEREAIVDEPTVDALFGFGGKTDEGWGRYCAEKSPSRRHLSSVAFMDFITRRLYW